MSLLPPSSSHHLVRFCFRARGGDWKLQGKIGPSDDYGPRQIHCQYLLFARGYKTKRKISPKAQDSLSVNTLQQLVHIADLSDWKPWILQLKLICSMINTTSKSNRFGRSHSPHPPPPQEIWLAIPPTFSHYKTLKLTKRDLSPWHHFGHRICRFRNWFVSISFLQFSVLTYI